MKRLGREIWGFLFWTYERGGIRYDIMVGLILAFIFLTPRGFFKDRPPSPSRQQIEVLEDGGYQLDAKLLSRETRNLEDGARRLLNAFTGKKVRVLRVEPVMDADGHVESYQVWVEGK